MCMGTRSLSLPIVGREFNDNQRIVMDTSGPWPPPATSRSSTPWPPTSVGPPDLGHTAAHPPPARRPRGLALVTATACTPSSRPWVWSAASRAAAPSSAKPPCPPATASTSRQWRPTPSTSTSTTPRCPARPTCSATALRRARDVGRPRIAAALPAPRRPPARAGRVRSHLTRRGLAVEADQVLIVDGAQHGLATTAMAMLTRRRRRRRRADLSGLQGARRDPAPGTGAATRTASGPDLDALDRCAAATGARRLRDADTAQPAGVGLDAAARAAGRDRRRHGLLLIEDAAYAFLAEEPRRRWPHWHPSSPSTSPGSPRAWPPGCASASSRPTTCIPEIERAIRATTWNTPAVMTAIACRWLRMARSPDWRRRSAATRAPGRRSPGRVARLLAWPSHVVLPVGPARRGRAGRPCRPALTPERVAVSTAEPFATSAHVPHALRLALGSTDVHTLRETLCRVRQVVEEDAYR